MSYKVALGKLFRKKVVIQRHLQIPIFLWNYDKPMFLTSPCLTTDIFQNISSHFPDWFLLLRGSLTLWFLTEKFEDKLANWDARSCQGAHAHHRFWWRIDDHAWFRWFPKVATLLPSLNDELPFWYTWLDSWKIIQWQC